MLEIAMRISVGDSYRQQTGIDDGLNIFRVHEWFFKEKLSRIVPMQKKAAATSAQISRTGAANFFAAFGSPSWQG